jgi:hypothetical protein
MRLFSFFSDIYGRWMVDLNLYSERNEFTFAMEGIIQLPPTVFNECFYSNKFRSGAFNFIFSIHTLDMKLCFFLEFYIIALK